MRSARVQRWEDLPTPSPATIDLPDGGTAALNQGVLEVRDGEGRLRIRYEGGAAEIIAPDGDLKLSAPRGKVAIAAGTELSLDAPKVHLKSHLLSAAASQVQLFAREVVTTAERITDRASHHEVIAERVVTRGREALREIHGLAEERIGRVRALVEETFSLSSRRTVMRSNEETSIDGKRVLLG